MVFAFNNNLGQELVALYSKYPPLKDIARELLKVHLGEIEQQELWIRRIIEKYRPKRDPREIYVLGPGDGLETLDLRRLYPKSEIIAIEDFSFTQDPHSGIITPNDVMKTLVLCCALTRATLKVGDYSDYKIDTMRKEPLVICRHPGPLANLRALGRWANQARNKKGLMIITHFGLLGTKNKIEETEESKLIRKYFENKSIPYQMEIPPAHEVFSNDQRRAILPDKRFGGDERTLVFDGVIIIVGRFITTSHEGRGKKPPDHQKIPS